MLWSVMPLTCHWPSRVSRLRVVCALLTGLSAHTWATELQAIRTQTFGCFFGNTTEGILGATQDLRTLNTEISGGVRPGFLINIIGSATLSLAPDKSWVFNGSILPDVSTQLILRTSSKGGEIQPLPHTYATNGLRSYFLEIHGTRSTGFFEAGDYKVIATFNCI